LQQPPRIVASQFEIGRRLARDDVTLLASATRRLEIQVSQPAFLSEVVRYQLLMRFSIESPRPARPIPSEIVPRTENSSLAQRLSFDN
jgi:hypothetical protein